MFKLLKATLLTAVAIGTLVLSSQKVLADSSVPQEKVPSHLPKELFDDTRLTPTQVYDNLYCIGSKSVVAWAIKTSEGFILIDSMWDDKDGKFIIEGMKKLGLDPKEIKYILVSHGHGDHYGGAQYIKEYSNAKILMSETDYNYMNSTNEGANGPRSRKCIVDEFAKDGQEVTLGDTSVLVVETPGHSPGGLSFIYPVKQDGKTYMSAIWGGTGSPRELTEKIAYRNSIDHFEKYTSSAHVTVETTAHLFTENGYQKLEDVRTRKVGEVNPFYMGEEGFTNYLNSLRKTINIAIANQEAKSVK